MKTDKHRTGKRTIPIVLPIQKSKTLLIECSGLIPATITYISKNPYKCFGRHSCNYYSEDKPNLLLYIFFSVQEGLYDYSGSNRASSKVYRIIIL